MAIDASIPLGVRVPNIMGAAQQGMSLGRGLQEMRQRKQARQVQKEKTRKLESIQAEPMPNDPRAMHDRLMRIFQIDPQLAQAQAALYEKRQAQQQAQMERTRELIIPHSAEFSKFDEGQKAQYFVNWREMLRNQGAIIDPRWEKGYTPQIGKEIEMLGSVPLQRKGTKSFEEEKALIDARTGAKLEVAKGKSDIKVEQPLTESEKSREKISQSKLGLAVQKGQREEKLLGFQEEKAEINKGKALEAHKALKMKNASQIEEIKGFSSLAKKLAKSTALSGVTGVGKIGKFVPGTEWANVNADLERLMAMGAIASMVKMKAESPTGSTGFGALSQKELKVIQDSFAALENKNQSPSHMREELNRISNVMDKYLKRIEDFESGGPVKKRSTRITPKAGKDVKNQKSREELLNEIYE